MAVVLTRRDVEILDALTKRVRVLSIPQIARTWWKDAADSERVASNRLRTLQAEKLVHIERLPAHPELLLEGPAATWWPGDAAPDFSALSYRLQSRWKRHPVLTACVSASKLAANRFGGYGGRPPRAVERTHDVHMAQVYLLYRTRNPELVRHWVFEEQVKAERRREKRAPIWGEKLPDAFIRSEAGIRVVEFGGAYNKDKLTAFHGYCKDHLFSYEIW
jgi:hypothetical protein